MKAISMVQINAWTGWRTTQQGRGNKSESSHRIIDFLHYLGKEALYVMREQLDTQK